MRALNGPARAGGPRLAALLSLALLALAVLPTPVASGAPTTTISAPCGRASSASITRVAWIVLENVGYSVVGSPSAPYFNSLADRCALATDFLAVSHPSLPNYLALTTGSTQGITDDGEPRTHPLHVASLFSQLRGRWRVFAESMPTPCDHVTSGEYAARHNPAVYLTNLPSCPADDLPFTQPLDLSAVFTMFVPNVCDDMHSCPVATGDAWLARYVALILASPQYRRGTLALFITVDENDQSSINRVPTIVVAPSVPRGLRLGTAFTSYSLLRTTEALLHLPFLAGARSASSMLKGFRL